MGVTMEEVRRLTIVAGSKGIDAVAAELKGVAAAQDQVATSADGMARRTDESTRTIIRAGKQFDAFAKSMDPVLRSQAELEKGQKIVATALNQGAITGDQAARALALLAGHHDRASAAAKRSELALLGQTGAMQLNRVQQQMLVSSLSNSFSSIGSGAGVLQVVIQQGADVAQAFGMNDNGVGGTFRALGSLAARVFSPMVMGSAALAAVAGVAGYGFVRFRSETEALSAALDGLGRRSGETVSSLSGLAARGAAAGGLSLSAGRDAAATFAGAGIGGPVAEGLIATSRTYARVTGTDLAEANKTLAAAFADPVKGAQQLGDALGFLDERTRVSIRSLVAQGDLFAGRKVLFDALSRDLATATDRTTGLAHAWEWLKRVGSDAASTAGKGASDVLYGKSVQDQIDETIVRITALRAEMRQTVSASAGRYGITQASADASSRLALPLAESRLEALQRISDREDRLAAGRMADQNLMQASSRSAGYVNAVLPELERRRSLTDQIVNLQKAADDPARLAMMGTTAYQVASAIGLLNDQLGQTLSALDKIRLEGDLVLRGITARTVGDRALLARDRALGGVGWDAASPELRLAGENASRQVLEQAKKEAEDRLRAANDNARLAGLLAYPRQRAEIDTRWNRQDQLDAVSPTALAANSAARKAELDALARTSIAAPLDEANRSLEAQNRLLAVNAATFGMSTDRVVAARTIQEKLNEYMAAGVPITDQLRAGIVAYGTGAGQTALALEELDRRQKAVVQGMDDLRSMSKGVFSSLLRGDAKGALRLLGDRAIDSGAGFLTDQLFGKAGKPGGGLFGDFIGDLFGKSQGLAVATQNVQAGVVNLAGALPGLGGIGSGVGGGLGLGGPTSLAAPGGAEDYLGRMFRIESGGNPLDRTGSNYGIAQFGYADMKRWGLSNPFDVGQSTTASLLEARTNAAALQPVLGRDVTGADLYLAHQQGLAGAKALYQNPDQPAWAAVRPFYGSDDIAKRAITGNAGSLDMTSRQFTDMWAGRYAATKPLDLSQIDGAGKALQQFKMTTNATSTDLGSFGDGLGKMGSTLFNGLTGQGGGGGGGLLGGLLGAFFGLFKGGSAAAATPTLGGLYALGGAFHHGSVVPFADGGIVSSPTRFGLSGGRTGLMGEAGPEAIVPLSRDRSGRLGVRLSGPMPQPAAMVGISTQVTIAGSTIIVQGAMDDAAGERLKGELDARDARLRKHVSDTILTQNRRAAAGRG